MITKTEGKIEQILMKHPDRGYRWMDRAGEAYCLRRGWMICTDMETREYMAKEEARKSEPKPLAPMTEVEVMRKQIDELKAQLAAKSNGHNVVQIEVPEPTVTIVPGAGLEDTTVKYTPEYIDEIAHKENKTELHEVAKEFGVETHSNDRQRRSDVIAKEIIEKL